MKVIQIWKSFQDAGTKPEHLELVEQVLVKKDDTFAVPVEYIEKIPYWNVRSEMLKHGETYHQWLLRVKEKITLGIYRDKGVEGIYFYDVQSIGGILDGVDDNKAFNSYKCGMMVRYDYIYKSNLNQI